MNNKRFQPGLIYILFLLYLSVGIIPLQAALPYQAAPDDTVLLLDKPHNLYKWKHLYFGGKPDTNLLVELKKTGVRTIINLRSKRENKIFRKLHFNEKEVSIEMGFTYISIPVTSLKSVKPKTMEAFKDALAKGDSAFVHCASGLRVSYLYMIFLVEEMHYPVEEAVKFGNKIGSSTYLNNMLRKRYNISS